nr:hypothetical protein [Sunxiuqinia sp.]
MRVKFYLRLSFLVAILTVEITGTSAGVAMDESYDSIPKLDNPMSVKYLNENLRRSLPRLVLTSSIKDNLRRGLKNNPMVRNLYNAIQLNAKEVMREPFLERKLEGRRLLQVSREMLYRINMLGIIYCMERDQ